MHHALPRRPADTGDDVLPSALTGLLAHLDPVYGFALTLTGNSDHAATLTEDVFDRVNDDLWTTLGGHGLRERLLARCVATFIERRSSGELTAPATPASVASRSDHLSALLFSLPWNERAAIALVDRLGLGYAAGAAVLGVDVPEFRTLLRRGRSVLFDAHRALAR